MTTARDELLGHIDDPTYHELTRAYLEPLWLEAANERLALQRERIPVLGKLADDVGISEIRSLEDLVPLLFAHSSYKSYPDAFIRGGRWDLMTAWLDTLSSSRIAGVDVSGVSDQDEWVERLREHDHWIFVTSGTTGKNSFLPGTRVDRDFSLRMLEQSTRNNYGGSEGQRAVFVLGPKFGPHRSALHFRTIAETYGRPDARFYLTEEPLRASEVGQMAELQRKLVAGTAKPSEITAAERQQAERQAEMAARLDELVDALLEHRHEPMIICGFWAQYWTVVEAARARGIPPGDFHPDIQLSGGGGNKGGNLPPDYKEQILAFFGIPPEKMRNGYSMSELSAPLTAIDGRFRSLPWVIPLVLDDSGEKLVHQESGQVAGRFAFLDLATDGRWGGLVTGDRVVADFDTPNVSILADSITRYSLEQGGDDKLTCAGTIDAYVRGVIA